MECSHFRVSLMSSYHRLLPLIGLLLISGRIQAQSNSTYDFLRNDVSARAAALGGNFVTATDDPNLIFYNPAGLATLSRQRVSVGFYKHLLDINSGYASIGTEIQGLGFVGAGVDYINYGEFKQTGEDGQDLGTFGAGELAFVVGFGSTLAPEVTYGVNAKFIYSQIADARSTGAAIDLGVQYIAVPNRVTVGASLRNLGTQLSPYVTTREDLPLDLTVGAAVYPEHLPATLFLGFHRLTDHQDDFGQTFRNFNVGAEFAPGPNVHFRVGYDNGRRQDLKILQSSGLAGISLGLGINTDAYGIDYAYSSLGQIGAMHRISITF